MVTFNLRVDAQFPVAGHFAFIAEDSAITIERITGELFLQSPELLVERQVGLLREIDDDKAFPKCNMDRHQPKRLFVEVEEITRVRNVHHVALAAENPPLEVAREVLLVPYINEWRHNRNNGMY